MHSTLKTVKTKAVHFLSRHVSYAKRTEEFIPVRESQNEMDDIFVTEDGRQIPVLKYHRYAMKKCWLVFGPIAALCELSSKGVLSNSDKKNLKEFIGYRTITQPLSVVRECLSPYLDKYEDFFLSTEIPDIGRRVLKPQVSEVSTLISKKISQHRVLFDKTNRIVGADTLRSGDNILEIGYTSGGESIVAFERLGFNAFGIDNFYHDSIQSTNRHDLVQKIADSHVDFGVGDITTRTVYNDDFFSAVYSLSVLEHIVDIPAAFAEMYRILKPGGVMVHRYDPFFHISGAHSHGTLDSPWAHMRISEVDTERYIRQFRPHEADILLPLIRNGLNRRHTMSFVQAALVKAGFKIRMWETECISPSYRQHLSPDILGECLQGAPNIVLDDLINKAVLFIAEKPRG